MTDLRWKLPLHRDPTGTYIFDADNTMVAQIRGWGHLTGTGGLHLSADDAEDVQFARLDTIARAVNLHEELLAALREIDKWARDAEGGAARVYRFDFNSPCGVALRAAIAKAEGRAS